jgi:hypothetical protein
MGDSRQTKISTASLETALLPVIGKEKMMLYRFRNSVFLCKGYAIFL